jgi:ABC-type lipoprotein export system ATPase subunit
MGFPHMSLELKNLRKSYFTPDGAPTPVIDIPAFKMSPGQQVALVGSSGCGKTTLLHLISGILAADSGSVVFTPPRGGALAITSLSEARRDVARGQYMGYIFQTHHLLPGLTALENVLLGMSFTGRAPDRMWATHLLTEVGLADHLNYKPGRMSVGQQQRVAVARALANKPALVLADEPTGSLDAVNAQQVVGLIQSLCREVNAMLLLVSHDPAVTGRFETVLKLQELNRAAA